MPFAFPHFIIAAIPHVKCDVGSGRENEEYVKDMLIDGGKHRKGK